MERIDYETWEDKHLNIDPCSSNREELTKALGFLAGMFTSYMEFNPVHEKYYEMGTKFAKAFTERSNPEINTPPPVVRFIFCCFLPIDMVEKMFIEDNDFTYEGEPIGASNAHEYFILTRAVTLMDCDPCIDIWNKVEFQPNELRDRRLKLLWEIIGPRVRRLQNKRAE